MQNKFKKLLSVYCLLSIILVSVFIPKKAEALVFHDPLHAIVSALNAANTTALATKEYVLDQVVTVIVRATVRRVVASTVNWINSGFNGSPAFITDPEQYFKNIADGVAGQLIYNNPNFRFMCAPFRARVQIAINQAYNQPFGQFQCTLSGVVNNYDAFIQDFSQGGWDGFIQVSQNSQNNPIGLFSSWRNETLQKVNSKAQQKQTELGWGKGLLSFRGPCKQYGPTPPPVTLPSLPGPDGTMSASQTYQPPAPCEREGDIETPGTVIENQLNGVLSLDNQSLINADEINELIGALLGQLTGRIVGGLGSLRSSGSQSYTSSLVNDANQLNSQAGGLSQNNFNNTNLPLDTSGNGVQAEICILTDGSPGGSIDAGVSCYPGCTIPTSTLDALLVNGVCTDVNTLSMNNANGN